MKSKISGLNKLQQINIDLDRTLLGGQAFNWDKIEDVYYGFFEDKIMKITENNGELYWQTYPIRDDVEFASRYLDLDRNYRDILEKINKDKHIELAIQSHSNVRVLKQDFNQTLISFIFTSHKNIKAVRKLIREMSKLYGSSIVVDGIEMNYFPKLKQLRELSDEDFRKLGAGFRSKYIVQAIDKLAKGTLSEAIFSNLDSNAARTILMQNDGIGEKIADCILAFSLSYTDITPIDIWGKRVLTEIYGLPENSSYKTLSQWYTEYFGQYTVFAGQILFEYIRENYPHFSRTSNH